MSLTVRQQLNARKEYLSHLDRQIARKMRGRIMSRLYAKPFNWTLREMAKVWECSSVYVFKCIREVRAA